MGKNAPHRAKARQVPGNLSVSQAVYSQLHYSLCLPPPGWCRFLHAALQLCCAWLLHEEAHLGLAECKSHCCLLYNAQHSAWNCFEVSILGICTRTNVRKLFPKAPSFPVMTATAQVSLWQATYLILEIDMLWLKVGHYVLFQTYKCLPIIVSPVWKLPHWNIFCAQLGLNPFLCTKDRGIIFTVPLWLTVTEKNSPFLFCSFTNYFRFTPHF